MLKNTEKTLLDLFLIIRLRFQRKAVCLFYMKYLSRPLLSFFVLLLLWVASTPLVAQTDSSRISTYSSWHSKQIIVQDTVILDSLSVFPNSVLLTNTTGANLIDSTYAVVNNLLIFEQLPTDTILQVRYKTLPFALHESRQHKDVSRIGEALQYDGLIGTPYTYNPFATAGADAFNFNDLDYSGVFARGISVGNNQDLILNSNFNMQVAGKLGDIEILGAISDNNIPLQPEGNTQQLQDFDRIFIQFKYQKQRLIAGDYDLKRPEGSYFVNYFRRLQGGQLQTDLRMGKNARLKTDASFAVSKGKFARNTIQGQEGNQGPYKLQGNSGEQFIIIVAGTERVFIDGKLLTRGADNDYTIDYNLGEIIFSPRQLITKDKRIQIEFSYTDLTYLRTLATANTTLEHKKYNVRFNFYSEQDSKGQSVTGDLSDAAKDVLTQIGDDTDQAFVSGISIPSQDDENTGTIFYKLIDTLVGSFLFDSVLVYSTNIDSAIYAAKFSQVTEGGDYIRVQNGANGVVYKWVGIDTLTGMYQGTHRAIRLLSTPKAQQLFNFGTDIKLGKNGIISADIALSNKDQNTFSTIGNSNNQGLAARLTFQQAVPLYWGKINKKTDSTTTDTLQNKIVTNTLIVAGHYEYLEAQFESIEPYRTREFARDWNISSTEQVAEHWYHTSIGLQGRKWGNVSYQFSGLHRLDEYDGFKHTVNINTKYKGFEIVSSSSLLQNETEEEAGLFIRPKADVSYTFQRLNNLKVGAYFEQEYNQRTNLLTDSLLSSSFYYNVFKAYTELKASDNVQLSSFYARRYDYEDAGTDFENNTIADDLNFSGEWKQSKSSTLTWNLNYRNLNITDSTISTQEAKETYLGRLEYILNIKKGFIRSNTIYELGAGQQQKVEYNYVQVDKGQGTHVWVDRNEDDVQQINEFEQANFVDQADYIRVTLLTGDFIKTNNVGFSQSLVIQPQVLFKKGVKNKKGKKPFLVDFLGRISTRSIFKIERKTYADAAQVVAINPFQLNVADSALVSVGSNIRNNLFFNRSGNYSIELGQTDSRSKTLLTTGFDTRDLSEYSLRQRLNFRRKKAAQKPKKSFLKDLKLQVLLETAFGSQGNTSEFFPDRDFSIAYYRIEPEFTFLYQRFLRIALKYRYDNKQNQVGNQELLISHNLTTEVTFNQLSKTNIKGSFSYVNLAFDGDLTTPVGYTMVAGLQTGNNFLWNLSVSQALSKNIQMTVSYEGRATGDSPIVHVGRAQIRANF